MVYQINVRIEDSKLEEFLKIIQSFKKLGLVKGYDDYELEKEITDSFQDDELLEMVKISRQQIAAGKGLTTGRAREKVKTWQKL
ncbi:MAG TPA: hypothetical protein ENJ95_17880 [Bacteroidetes bacterium]|nr:hypothetical protein [Bacteroidota bacterium]